MHENILKVACLVSHPIQYQVPLFRKITKEKKIDFEVIFISSMSIGKYVDKGFNTSVKWDIPLLGGYKGYFLDKVQTTFRVPRIFKVQINLWMFLKKNKYEVLWIHGWGNLTCLAAIIYCKLLGIKILMRGESGVHLRAPGSLKRVFRETFMRFIKHNVDGFLAIGSNNYNYYKMYGIDENKISIVPYAVDNEFFKIQVSNSHNFVVEYRKNLYFQEKLIILFASKLEKRKRADLLIGAFQNMLLKWESKSPWPELLIVGDGVEMKSLRKMVKESFRSNIKFLGFKNQTELPKYYALADIFVLPSEQEPWGLVVNEAMNAYCAIIVSNEVGAAKDLIKDYESGLTFTAGSLGDLEAKLKLLCEDSCLVEKISKGAQENIMEWSYKEDTIGLYAALEKLYQADFEFKKNEIIR